MNNTQGYIDFSDTPFNDVNYAPSLTNTFFTRLEFIHVCTEITTFKPINFILWKRKES
jgi:hypothetical protein